MFNIRTFGFGTAVYSLNDILTPNFQDDSLTLYVKLYGGETQNDFAYIDNVEFYGSVDCNNPPNTFLATPFASCSNNGKITLNWTGGVSPFTINYSGAATGSTPSVSGTSQTITGLVTGNYNLTVTDANNCTATTTTTVSADNSCRCSDSLQLVSLYNATNGANWTNKWILTQPMTTWYGVTLNGSGCVTCIDLDGDSDTPCNSAGSIIGNNLQGNLPNLNLPNL